MTPALDEPRKRYLVAQLRRYWPRDEDAVLRLQVEAAAPATPEALPPRLVAVALPDWASDIGIDGGLLIAQQFLVPGPREAWLRADWWAATFWYLSGTAERAYEQAHGPIHSYSLRLKGWDARMWERAWANRIALFLRRWAARGVQQDETALFGPLPAAEVILTHDVDAIRKTTAIRLKQSAFNGYNALRMAGQGSLGGALAKLAAAIRFLFSSPDYWHFDEIEKAEERAGVRSCFFVYGGDPRRRSVRQMLLDPGYDVREARLAGKLRALSANGWQIGLHQSFDAWHSAGSMAAEKSRVEEAIGAKVTMCRQHWLRFGWRETWQAQETAGLETDATLGFNDRPSFRNGAALRCHPWNAANDAAARLVSLPMILMDSQLYDYAALSDQQRETEISRWLGEVRAVAGVGSVIWHQHVLGPDYGWRPGLDSILARMERRKP